MSTVLLDEAISIVQEIDTRSTRATELLRVALEALRDAADEMDEEHS